MRFALSYHIKSQEHRGVPGTGMGKDQGKNSELEEHDAVEGGPIDLDKPPCPKCGWHNTRLSLSKHLVDSFLRTFSLKAYRCRACGKRFHVFRRSSAH